MKLLPILTLTFTLSFLFFVLAINKLQQAKLKQQKLDRIAQKTKVAIELMKELK